MVDDRSEAIDCWSAAQNRNRMARSARVAARSGCLLDVSNQRDGYRIELIERPGSRRSPRQARARCGGSRGFGPRHRKVRRRSSTPGTASCSEALPNARRGGTT